MPELFLFGGRVHKRLLAIVALLGIATAAYLPGLSGPLLFDDIYNLKPIEEWLQGLRDWRWVLLNNTSGLFGRPVAVGSLMLNVIAFGNGVMALKAVNLAIHLANGVLVWVLFQGFLQRASLSKEPGGAEAWTPLFAAAIWLLHPLLVSTVLYVIQRMALLSTFFTLIAMIAYLHGRTAIGKGAKYRGWPLLATAAFATILATLSKENGALAPSLCAVIELCLFAPRPPQRRHWASRGLIGLGLFLPAIIAATAVAIRLPLAVGGYENRPFTLSERVLTQSRVLWDYIGSFLLPNGPRLGLFHDDYALSSGLLSPPATLAAILAWGLLLLVAWHFRQRIPGLIVGLGIYLVGHALESTILPLLIYFEHRNYLPAIGLAWAIASVLAHVANALRAKLDNPKLVYSFASLAIVGVLAAATWARAGVWSSHEAILTQGLVEHPDSKWARMDAIRFEMMQRPTDYAAARAQIEALLESKDPDARRAGAAWGLMWSCLQEKAPDPSFTKGAFEGGARTIEADLLSIYEAWGTLVRIRGCPGMSSLDAAEGLLRVANETAVPQEYEHVRRIRYKAAELLLDADDPVRARKQAAMAYTGLLKDAPVAGLLVVLDISSGNFGEARTLLQFLDRQVPHYDRQNRQMIAVLKDYLQGAQIERSPRPTKQAPRVDVHGGALTNPASI